MATKKADKKFGWHFLPASMKLTNGDGRKAEAGKTLSIGATQTPVVCRVGMHASENPSQAAGFKAGPVLTYVEVSGQLDLSDIDKFCGRHRKILWAKEMKPRDILGILKDAGIDPWHHNDVYALIQCLGSHGHSVNNEKLNKAIIKWADKNGRKSGKISPVLPEKPGLTEKVVLSFLMPRVIRTAKEIAADLGNCYKSHNENYYPTIEESIQELLCNSYDVNYTYNVTLSGDDGWTLKPKRKR